MATGPKVAETPLELLTNNGVEPTVLSKLWPPVIAGVVGFVGVICANWATRRPFFSGIQKHIGVTAVCVMLGKYVDNYRNQYLADRDAVLRHYVELHPEDFPPFERKKFKELFEPWIPIR